MINSNSITTAAVLDEVEVGEGEDAVEVRRMEVEGEVLLVDVVVVEDAMEEEAVMEVEDEKEGEDAMEVGDEKEGEVEEGAEGEDLLQVIANSTRR